MKLNNEGRNELRKNVEYLLKNVPKNKKIQLPKETLEMLLFETYTFNKEKNIKIKIPVWSGDFLCKLDLSQVDFEDVSWSILGVCSNNSESFNHYWDLSDHEDADLSFQLSNHFCHLDCVVKFDCDEGCYCVNYSNTNAKIDFSKSFEFKNNINKYFLIVGCNFSNIDLSCNDFSVYDDIFLDEANFSNCNMTIPGNVKFGTFNCDLSNNKLNDIEIDGNDVFLYNQNSWSSFVNTEIKIKLDYYKIKSKIFNDLKKLEIGEEKEIYSSEFEDFISYFNKYWIGCYINDILLVENENIDEFNSLLNSEGHIYASDVNDVYKLFEYYDSLLTPNNLKK